MSLHKLTARSGYDYLTPAGGALDATEKGHTGLASYYTDTLGVRFTERPRADPAKRPIREIVGVDPRLNQRWSTRRAHINTRRGELAIQFQYDHGRPPTADRRPRSRRCIWLSRRRWRPATPK